MANDAVPAAWQLGPWRIVPALNRLQNESIERTLEPRVMAALLLLIEAQGHVVSDEQMLAGVWPKQIVSDASLYKVIAELRKALGDSEKPYQYIERVSSKGYRLLMEAKAEIVAAPIQTNNLFSRQEQLQHPTIEQELRSGWSLDALRSGISKKSSSLWLWPIVLIIVALTLWELLPQNDTTKATTPVSDKTIEVNREQKPDDMAQNIWDDYLQARWLSAQRKPAELDQSITLLQSVLHAEPNFSAAEVALCNSYHFQHLYHDWSLRKVMALCEPLLRHALQTDASSAAALASFGLLKQSQGDADAAALYLDKSLALSPDDANALMWRANLYREQGAIDKALPLSERAAQLDPLSGMIKRHYAFTLINSGRVGEARQLFKEALVLEPDYSDRAFDELDMLPLTVQRARNYLQWSKRFPDRVAEANNPVPAIHLALVQLSLGNLIEADNALQIAERKFAPHQFTLLARAMWHSANGDELSAQKTLQQRAALQPHNPMYAVLPLLFSAQRDPVAVKQQFLALFPAFTDAQNIIARYLEQGRGQLVMYWLLTQTPDERQRYADTINAWQNQHPQSDNLTLDLLLLLGQTEKANQLAATMLQTGWLPSPGDDFYIAERHPLWQQLNMTFFNQLKQARQSVLR